jgi:hypothetical protein
MVNDEYKPLTVSELIEVLKQFNPDKEVQITYMVGFKKYIHPIVKARIEDNKAVEIDITLR